MSDIMQRGSRAPLKAGDYAPDFTLSTDGGTEITLSNLKGKNVVIYFYPKDDTPGCTQEAKDFTAAKQEFDALDTVLIGVSKDSVECHEKFKEKYNINFSLGSDQQEMVCEAYDCWVEKNMYGKQYMGVQRDSFLIDKAGRIKKVWRKVKVDGHVEEVLNAARGLN
jgi:peroxiredoxin